MNEEFKKWWQMAKDDLNSAEANFDMKIYYACANYSQQAVEKALKSLLLKKSGDLIKVHDLFFLGKKINLPKELLDKCKIISNIYLETKYVGITGTIPSEKFNEANSLEYFNIAKEILSWVEKNI